MNKQELTPPQIRLVEMMQQLGFGRIEGLVVRAGEPVFDPPPGIVIEHKFGGVNGPRSEAELQDFALRTEVRELLDEIVRLGDDVIECIEVKHGVPFRMIVRKPAA